MYLVLISFGDGQVDAMLIVGKTKLLRTYSIASLIFPSAKVEVYELVRVM